MPNLSKSIKCLIERNKKEFKHFEISECETLVILDRCLDCIRKTKIEIPKAKAITDRCVNSKIFNYSAKFLSALLCYHDEFEKFLNVDNCYITENNKILLKTITKTELSHENFKNILLDMLKYLIKLFKIMVDNNLYDLGIVKTIYYIGFIITEDIIQFVRDVETNNI